MNRNRVLLASVFVLALIAITIGFFCAMTAVAQQAQISASAPIPKDWGRLVAQGAYPSGGTALYFEAADGTVRIVKLTRVGVPDEIIKLYRKDS